VRLKLFAAEVSAVLSDEDLPAIDGGEALGDYELDFERTVELGDLEQALKPFQGRELSSVDDGEMAIAVRSHLPLTAREASDRHLWWWLNLRLGPRLVRARWVKDGAPPTISRARVLGPVNRNALARLWWGAQMVRELDDADRYTRLMFANQDLFEAVIGRSLGRYPEVLAVILDALSSLSGLQARETVRDLGARGSKNRNRNPRRGEVMTLPACH
jgi:hypothetical protein